MSSSNSPARTPLFGSASPNNNARPSFGSGGLFGGLGSNTNATTGFGSASTPSVASTLFPQPSSKEIHSKSLVGNIARLFNDAKYSDATVRIHNVLLPVHKSIICTQSAYFEKAFNKGFKEGDSGVLWFKESSGEEGSGEEDNGEEGSAAESSAAAHWRVFEYLYKGTYSGELSDVVGFEGKLPMRLVIDSRVYLLADKFLLKDLKTLSHKKFVEKLETGWILDSFPDCIREVYDSTYSMESILRSAVLNVAVAYASELGRKESFKELLQEGGDFAVEYVDALTKQISISKR